MTTKENGTADLVCSSYEIAWQEYSHPSWTDTRRTYVWAGQVALVYSSYGRSRRARPNQNRKVCFGNDARIRADSALESARGFVKPEIRLGKRTLSGGRCLIMEKARQRGRQRAHDLAPFVRVIFRERPAINLGFPT